MAERKNYTDTALRAVAVLGLIAVLLLGAWGIIQIAFNLPSFMSSVGGWLSSPFTREEAPEAPVGAATTTPAAPTPPAPSSPKTSVSSTKGTPASKGTYTPSGRYSDPYGAVDLAVYITSAQPLGTRATLQFVVENVGSKVSPAYWSFDALLPIGAGYRYPVGGQRALYPGDKMLYTLTFDLFVYGYPYGSWGPRVATIIVDPQHVLREFNTFNNTASVSM
jgi:hypothetical protein